MNAPISYNWCGTDRSVGTRGAGRACASGWGWAQGGHGLGPRRTLRRPPATSARLSLSGPDGLRVAGLGAEVRLPRRSVPRVARPSGTSSHVPSRRCSALSARPGRHSASHTPWSEAPRSLTVTSAHILRPKRVTWP